MCVEVPETRKAQSRSESESAKRCLKRRLLDVQDALTAYYSNQLFGEAGAGARAYLQRRGMSRRAAEAFRLGWSSGDRHVFDRWAQAKSIDLNDLVHLGGSFFPMEDGRPTDRCEGAFTISRATYVSRHRFQRRCNGI